MSILIKGMEMPTEEKGRRWVMMTLHSDGTVEYLFPGTGWNTIKNGAVEVPTPHGDLVDIDKALNHLPANYNKKDLEDAVATAPTIIEAEGEGDDE